MSHDFGKGLQPYAWLWQAHPWRNRIGWRLSDGRHVTVDPQIPPRLSRFEWWCWQFHRRSGPTVKYWSATFDLLHTEPVKPEPWPAYARRQFKRLWR